MKDCPPVLGSSIPLRFLRISKIYFKKRKCYTFKVRRDLISADVIFEMCLLEGNMKIFKNLLISAMAFSVITGCSSVKEANMTENNVKWDKVFGKSEKVTIQKVHFKNRFGIELTGDLYAPKNMKSNAKMPALALCGPFGAVKEQVSGLYAQKMAERGFISLAFDASYTGESGGEPRDVASPDINTEDFSAAIDFLSNYPNVDPEKIGIIGICGFGGFAINAAAIDTRIKATVAVTMYDMTRVSAKGYNDSIDANARYAMKEQLSKQRTEDFKNGAYAKAPGLPKKLNGDEPQFVKDYFSFYKTPLGFHERSIASNRAWNTTSTISLINQPILAYSDEIRNAVLVVHGENAHSRYFSEDAFKKLKGDNKELLIVPDANHVDLYHDCEKIPFDKIEAFLKKYLNG